VAGMLVLSLTFSSLHANTTAWAIAPGNREREEREREIENKKRDKTHQ